MTLRTSVKVRQVEKCYLMRKKGGNFSGYRCQKTGQSPDFHCIVLSMPEPLNKRSFNKTLSILFHRKLLGPYLPSFSFSFGS